MELGPLLRNFRVKNRISQEILAEKLGVNQATVHNWECGKSSPPLILLPKLAEVLDTNVQDLTVRIFIKDC